MYVIREVAPYSRYAPFAKVRVRGLTMGIYAADQQPYSVEEGEREQSAAQLWHTVEEAQCYLRAIQRVNGTERKEYEG